MILAERHCWLTSMSDSVLTPGSLGKSPACTLRLRPTPLDNNGCADSIRSLAIGRKNCLFSDTRAVARASPKLYSFIEAAKVNDIEPHARCQRIVVRQPPQGLRGVAAVDAHSRTERESMASARYIIDA